MTPLPFRRGSPGPLYRVWDVAAEEDSTPTEERGTLIRAARHDEAATIYAQRDVDTIHRYGHEASWRLVVVEVETCADEGHDQRTIEVRCEVSYVPRVVGEVKS